MLIASRALFNSLGYRTHITVTVLSAPCCGHDMQRFRIVQVCRDFFLVRESEVLWLILNCSSWLWQQHFFSSEFSGKFELWAKACTWLSCILCVEQGVIDGVANIAKRHVWSSGNRKQGLFAEWHFWFAGRLLALYLCVAYSEILIRNGGTPWHMRDFPCT